MFPLYVEDMFCPQHHAKSVTHWKTVAVISRVALLAIPAQHGEYSRTFAADSDKGTCRYRVHSCASFGLAYRSAD